MSKRQRGRGNVFQMLNDSELKCQMECLESISLEISHPTL